MAQDPWDVRSFASRTRVSVICSQLASTWTIGRRLPGIAVDTGPTVLWPLTRGSPRLQAEKGGHGKKKEKRGTKYTTVVRLRLPWMRSCTVGVKSMSPVDIKLLFGNLHITALHHNTNIFSIEIK